MIIVDLVTDYLLDLLNIFVENFFSLCSYQNMTITITKFQAEDAKDRLDNVLNSLRKLQHTKYPWQEGNAVDEFSEEKDVFLLIKNKKKIERGERSNFTVE